MNQNTATRKVVFMCKGCRKKFKTLDQLQTHIANIDVKITYFCPPCNGFFDQYHPCNLSGKRCVYCRQLIGSKNPRYHPCFHEPVGKKLHDPFETPMDSDQEYENEVILHLKDLFQQKLATGGHTEHMCKVCEETFDTEEEMLDHCKRIVPRTFFFCKHCVNFFKEAQDHGTDIPCASSTLLAYCCYCKLELQRSQHKNHICFHQRIFATNDVDKDISFKDDLDFVYFCEACGKFLPFELKDVHQNQFHKNKTDRTTCSVCNIQFQSSRELTRHRIRIHNFSLCHICGLNVHNSKIKYHLDAHNNYKKLKCPKCDKRFNRKQCLRTHLLVHSDEAKWKCATCGKSFKKKYNLRVHIRKHTNIKPFECLICKKTFTTKQSRDGHLKTHNVLDNR